MDTSSFHELELITQFIHLGYCLITALIHSKDELKLRIYCKGRIQLANSIDAPSDYWKITI